MTKFKPDKMIDMPATASEIQTLFKEECEKTERVILSAWWKIITHCHIRIMVTKGFLPLRWVFEVIAKNKPPLYTGELHEKADNSDRE